MLYQNTDIHTRRWDRIAGPDGRTLELEPGGTVELDLPEPLVDPFLKPVPKPAAKSAPEEE